MLTLRKALLLVILGWLLIQPGRASADAVQEYLENQMALGWPDQKEAFNFEPNYDAAAFSDEIAAARREFWAAYHSGNGTAEAAAKFQRRLAAKDIYVLTLSIAVPAGTPLDILVGGLKKVDGGIPVSAQHEYDEWLRVIRSRTGRVVSDPLQAMKIVMDAIVASEAQRQRYVIARNFAEVDRERLSLDPRLYAILFVQRFPEPKTTAETSRVYQEMVKDFGEERIVKLTEALMKAPIDELDNLVHPEAFGVIAGRGREVRPSQGEWRNTDPVPEGLEVIAGARSRWQVFRYKLLSGEPRGYLLRLLLDFEHPTEVDLAMVKPTMQRMFLSMGEKAVLQAAETLQKATKRMEDGELRDSKSLGVLTSNPSYALDELLLKADPAGYARFLIAEQARLDSPEQIKAAYDQMARHAGGDAAMAKIMEAIATFWNTPPVNRVLAYRDLHLNRQSNYLLLQHAVARGTGAILGTMAAHPEFAMWARFEKGSMVTHEFVQQIIGTRNDNHQRVESKLTPPAIYRHAVDVVTPERVTMTGTQKLTPDSKEFPLQTAIPARIEASNLKSEILRHGGVVEWLQIPPDFPAHFREEQTITAAGRAFKCRLYEQTTKPRNRAHPTEEDLQLWLSDEVPGGIVLMRRISRYDDGYMTHADLQEYRLVEIKVVGTPAPPVALEVPAAVAPGDQAAMCAQCGVKLLADARFCTACGAKVTGEKLPIGGPTLVPVPIPNDSSK